MSTRLLGDAESFIHIDAISTAESAGVGNGVAILGSSSRAMVASAAWRPLRISMGGANAVKIRAQGSDGVAPSTKMLRGAEWYTYL